MHSDVALSQLFSAAMQASTSFWQNTPAHEETQVHVNLLMRSTHVEPFMHGDEIQSSSSISQL
jgi:hypothetical protein